MTLKGIISATLFVAIVAVGTYLVLDLESLTENELTFIKRLESDVAAALGEDPDQFFPVGGRLPSKFQAGGTPPAVYKLKITTGRRGRRLTFDLSIQRSVEKAKRKFETRWKHEQRAHRLGTLEPVALTYLDGESARLAQIRAGQTISGVFFMAHRGRALFGLTLKGITLEEFKEFERMLEPTLDYLERDGPNIML